MTLQVTVSEATYTNPDYPQHQVFLNRFDSINDVSRMLDFTYIPEESSAKCTCTINLNEFKKICKVIFLNQMLLQQVTQQFLLPEGVQINQLYIDLPGAGKSFVAVVDILNLTVSLGCLTMDNKIRKFKESSYSVVQDIPFGLFNDLNKLIENYGSKMVEE